VQATGFEYGPTPRELACERLEEELAELSAHLNAATARWLELALRFRAEGGAAGDDFARWLAFRCGISTREAREYVRVAEGLLELPLIGEAFRRGELTFTKVRSLVTVATRSSEEGLLELAGVLTASQLHRALRVYRQVTLEEARAAQELEYLDYSWAEDGSLLLRARLTAEDGTVVVRALEAARERVRERRREEGASLGPIDFEPPRPLNVEAVVELAQRALSSPEPEEGERARLVVHVDAASLIADRPGRSDLEEGPVISPETARRLGCEAESVLVLEQAGIPLSVGRTRRTVPPRLRRALEARDAGTCRFPGCERRRYLQAHHREHWARGGETSLQNLVLLCFQHHRLLHEGGYTIEDAPDGRLRFRNRYGVLCPSVPRSPPASADELLQQNTQAGITITAKTNRNGCGERMELPYVFDAVASVMGRL
jgi:hypothetical protein